MRECRSLREQKDKADRLRDDERRAFETGIREIAEKLSAAVVAREEEVGRRLEVQEMNKDYRATIDKLRIQASTPHPLHPLHASPTFQTYCIWNYSPQLLVSFALYFRSTISELSYRITIGRRMVRSTRCGSHRETGRRNMRRRVACWCVLRKNWKKPKTSWPRMLSPLSGSMPMKCTCSGGHATCCCRDV